MKCWKFRTLRNMSGSHFSISRKQNWVLKNHRYVWVTFFNPHNKSLSFEQSQSSRRRQRRRTNSQIQIQVPPNAPGDEILPQGRPSLLIMLRGCKSTATLSLSCVSNTSRPPWSLVNLLLLIGPGFGYWIRPLGFFFAIPELDL